MTAGDIFSGIVLLFVFRLCYLETKEEESIKKIIEDYEKDFYEELDL